MNVAKLELLCELKEKGLLTQQEFDEEKKRLLNPSNFDTTIPKGKICWQNVGWSLIIITWCFIVSILVMKILNATTGMSYDDAAKNVFGVSKILMALVLTIIAYKMKTSQYKNCASPLAIFIFTLVWSYLVAFFAIYEFLQIKQGKVALKQNLEREDKKA